MGIADAGISSLGNLATNILAARTLQLGHFGLFSITMLIGIICVGISRSLCGDPLTLLHSAAPEKERRQAVRQVCGAALLGAAAAFPLLVALVTGVMVVSRGDLATGLHLGLALGLVLPALVGQELLRAVAYSMGRPATAFANSLAWTLLLVAALLLVRPTTAPVFIILWGATALGGLLVGMVLNKVRPRLTSPRSWFSGTRQVSRKLLLDFGLTQVTAEGSIVLISMIAGAAEAALIRKGQIPLTPVIVLTNGMIAMAQPALVRQVAAGRSIQSLRAMVYKLGGAALLTSVLLGVLVGLLPGWLMVEIVGQEWDEARRLVPVLALYLGVGALAGAQGVALRALGRLGGQLRLRFVLTPISLLLVFLTAFGGALWATIGLCTSLLCVALAWAWLLSRPAVATETPNTTEA